MVDKLENIPDELQPPSPLETIIIENIEPFGELVMGVGSNWHIILTALCAIDNPNANKFLLGQKLKMSDRITKTQIFPRDGMALPDGEVYSEPTTQKKKEG